MPEIDYVVITAGSFDILRRGGLRGRRAPARGCSTSGSGRCPGVRDTETFVYLKLRKQTYAWGTR